MSSKTVFLDPREVMPGIEESNVHVTVSLSAYDVPKAMTVEKDEREGLIRIKFQYMDEEKAKERQVDDRLTVLLGEKSGKVLGFVLKPDRDLPRQISIRISQGADHEISRAKKKNQELNYRLIKKVIDQQLEPLLAF